MRLKIPMLLLALTSLCAAQYASNPGGPGSSTGNATWNPPGPTQSGGGGGPTYNARTDSCVDGTQPDCTCATLGVSCLPGVAGHPLAFRGESLASASLTDQQPYWRLPWTVGVNNVPAAMNTSGTDVDFGAYMVLATDESVANAAGFGASSGYWTVGFNSGDGGDFDLFSRDDHLLLGISSGGGDVLLYIDTTRFFAHTCAVNNPCVYYTGIRSGSPADATHLDGSGSNNWSRNSNTAANTFFELAGDGVTIWKVQVCGSIASGQHCNLSDIVQCATVDSPADCTLVRTAYVKFNDSSFGGVNCSATAPAGGNDRVSGAILPSDYVATWHGELTTSDQDDISFTAGGAGVWHASTAYTNPDSFIVHTVSNSLHCAYQATTSGTSSGSGSDPWTISKSITSVAVTSNVATVTLSGSLSSSELANYPQLTVTFAGLAGASFLNAQKLPIQSASNVSGSGTVTVNITHANYGPTGDSGTMSGITACPAAGATYTDGTVTWTAVAGNGGSSTKLDGQGPGFDWISYKPGLGCSRVNTRIPKYYRGSGWTGGGPASGDLLIDMYAACLELAASGATLVSGWNATNTCSDPNVPCQCKFLDSGTIHDGGSKMNGRYTGFSATAAGSGVQTSPSSCFLVKAGVPKPTLCQNYFWEVATAYIRGCLQTGGGSQCSGHSANGYNLIYKDKTQVSHLFSSPNDGFGAPTPGIVTIPSSLPGDHHSSARAENPPDTLPILIAQTDVPSAGRQNRTCASCTVPNGYGSKFYVTYYDEELGDSPQGQQNWPGVCPLPAAPCFQVFRFAHSFNTGASTGFSAQNAMGDMSWIGDIAVFTTDVEGTRGSSSAAWKSKASHSGGDVINPDPRQGNGTNTNHSSYQWQAGGNPIPSSKSGTVEPNWGSCQSVGQTCTETTCTGTGCTNIPWTNVGAPCNNLRADTSPAASTTFAVGDRVMQISGTAAEYVFEATCPGGGSFCTSASKAFDLNQCPAYGLCVDGSGTALMDGTIQWFNRGQNECKSDMVLIDLTSAHK